MIIFGANGLGRSAQEIFNSNDIIIYCFLDDDKSLHGQEFNDIVIMGRTDDDGYLKYIGKKCEAFVAYDDNTYRKNIAKMLKERRKVTPVNAIHKMTTIAPSASLGNGNFVNAGVTIGANCTVGNLCMLNTNAIIEHDTEIGDFVQIGAGSIINAGVKIGEEAFIGSGAIIVAGVEIGKGARVGAGSLVISSVEEGETVFGNPAKPIEG